MEEGNILAKLGIDWKLLLAQVVNFFLLLFILWKFAYKPILRALEKREKTVAKSIDDAKEIERNREASQAEREATIARAQQDAEALMMEARKAADDLKASIVNETRNKADVMVAKAEAETRAMKERIVTEAQADLAQIVVAASEKILQQKLDARHDEKLIHDAIKKAHP